MTRAHGLVLFGLGLGVFAGTTNQLLPAIAFWPALAVSCFGAFVFVKANHTAMEEADDRARKAVKPKLRNETMERFAEQQARTDGQLLASIGEREVRGVAAQQAPPSQLQDDELLLYEVDGAAAKNEKNEKKGAEFVVTTDVSFPLEIQEQGALADQIQKLKKLQDDGIITADEFATAKAKLLA